MSNIMRVCASIDLDAVCYNILQVQNKVGRAKVVPVIKANAYGHGAVEIAHSLIRNNNISYFAVATVEEAMELRNNAIDVPILVLGYSFDEQFENIVKYDITQTVFQFDFAKRLSDEAVRQKKIIKIHIKLDTGMGRIGYVPDDKAFNEIVAMSSLPKVKLEGIFTHFACADELDKSSAMKQNNLFVEFVKRLADSGINIPIRHVCNSAAIIDFDDRYFEMVRSGIMTYGLYPSNEVDKNIILLKPAMSLVSHISYIKTIHKGDCVSYGSTFTADSERIIATVPVGYGDGYPRQLSNKGRVLIGGKFAPIVGRVCMDQFMVDITDIKGVKQGDEVVLIGKMGDNQISVEELADSVGSFNYEFVCNINRRVPRVYNENGETIKIVDYLEL